MGHIMGETPWWWKRRWVGGGYQVRCSDTKPPFPCVLSINESINGPYHGRELHGGGRGKRGFGIR